MIKKYNILKGGLIWLMALVSGLAFAQNVGINSTGAAPAASAGLDVDFTNKGFLAPRMTLAQKNAISSPATGLLVYQTDGLAGFYYYNGSGWSYLTTSGTSAWALTGNNSISSNFIGTTNNISLPFRTNNTQRMVISSTGEVGIGTATPAQLLDVNGSGEFGATGTTGKINISNTVGNGEGASDIYMSDDKMLRISNHGITQTGASLQLKASNENYLFSFEGRGGFRYYSRVTLAEKFRVNDGGDIYLTTTGQNTAIDAKGNIDDYYQLNVQNQHSGVSASTDIVATNNDPGGNDYIDMGINSTLYDNSLNGVSNILNGRRTTYLYGNGARMVVGNSARLQPLVFFTNNSSQDGGDDARGTERMRINSTGEVIVNGPANGNTNSSSTTDDDYDRGNYKFQVNGTSIMDFLYYDGAYDYSDRRLKTDILRLDYGLKSIMNLNPVIYKLKKESEGTKHLGLIAQDVREVVPELVKGDESKENLAVHYTGLIPVLINAVKEQQAQIDDLKKLSAKQQETIDSLLKTLANK